MSGVAQNTFTIRGSSEFTEEGFSRISKKGQHHFHAFIEMTEPTVNAQNTRTYTAAAVLPLENLGPQRVKAFKMHATEQFWNNFITFGLGDGGRSGTSTIFATLLFTTSLGTELSSLDKTVTPVAFDYTSRQYRLESFTSSKVSQQYIDAFSNDNSGRGGAGYSANMPSFTHFPWMNRWVDMRTEPLVVGPQLVILFDVLLQRQPPMAFDVTELSSWFIDIDILTEDVSMTAEDIWFTRQIFNQTPENRLVYFRAAQTV